MLLQRCRDAVDQEARYRRHIGLQDGQRADAVDPHHGRGGVADHAARAAGVRGRDDRGEIADVDFALEHVARHRAADQRGRDVVEEARQHEHDGEQREPALPSVGQERRHLVRNAAVLEVPGQDRKAHQQQEQVREDHPFVLHVQAEAGQSGAELEAGEDQLVQDDRGEAGERDLKRAVVEERHAKQGHGEQDEVDRDAEDVDRRCGRPPGGASGGCRGHGRRSNQCKQYGRGWCREQPRGEAPTARQGARSGQRRLMRFTGIRAARRAEREQAQGGHSMLDSSPTSQPIAARGARSGRETNSIAAFTPFRVWTALL